MKKKNYSAILDTRQRRRWKREELTRAMRAAFADPEQWRAWWERVTTAQEELRREGNPRAYDLLAIAERSLMRLRSES